MAQARRATGEVWLSATESYVDKLADALASLRTQFHSRVRDSRLEGLAEFAAGASHEINNPLAVIRGNAQLLLAREVDQQRQRHLESIIRQTGRIHDLLHGTLQYARPSKPIPVPVRISDWLRRIVAEHQPEAEAKDVSLSVDVLSDEIEWGRFDPGQTGQALGHLIVNAVEAAGNGGWVKVTLTCLKQQASISVEDSGPGPAENDRDHLYDPFFSGREAGRGRGLGLAIAWRLARINGAEVQYISNQSGPTRFVLNIPVEMPAAERKSA
jgi:signal transduction histidine kinase